jgi:2-polyprenyl-6-methoxyphenol hydroxylase-like FAD-dependent oxidoreductase
LSCRIIDKKSGLSDKSKALGIHIRTMDVMEDCGFIDEVLREGLEVDNIIFKSKNKLLARASFTGVKANRHFLIDLPQDRTEAILNDGLNAKGLSVEWQTELTSLTQNKNDVSATLMNATGNVETVTAYWLIACDGAHSMVRHLTQEEFKGAEYKQNWWLADLIIKWDLPLNQMNIYLHEEGPLACFPMKNKRYRLVMTAPLHHDGDPTMDDIISTFERRSSDSAVLSNPLWITKFNLHHRQIQHYRRERIFFAGDAAHIHSPMGGQGLNTGIQDAYNLIWKLALVEKKKAAETILDSYHAERYPVGLKVLKKTDMMTKMILLQNPFLIALRNAVMSKMLSFSFIRNKLATDMAGLTISYANSPIVANQGSSKGFKAGYFLTDFNLQHADDQEMQPLHTIVQGTAHHLLLFAGLASGDITNLIEIAAFIKEKYAEMIRVHLILCHVPDDKEIPATVWLDPQQQVHRHHAIERSTVVLLRPDKYIGLTQSPVELSGIRDYLSGIFLSNT